MKNTKDNILRLVQMGLLSGLIILLQTVFIIPLPGSLTLSLVLVPIVVGAVLFGAKSGALLGGVFGLVRGAVIVMLIFSVVPTICSALESMNIPLLTDIINQSKLAVIVQENNMISGVISTLVK